MAGEEAAAAKQRVCRPKPDQRPSEGEEILVSADQSTQLIAESWQ